MPSLPSTPLLVRNGVLYAGGWGADTKYGGETLQNGAIVHTRIAQAHSCVAPGLGVAPWHRMHSVHTQPQGCPVSFFLSFLPSLSLSVSSCLLSFVSFFLCELFNSFCPLSLCLVYFFISFLPLFFPLSHNTEVAAANALCTEDKP